MAKKVVTTVRLNMSAGKAAAGPPVGPTLAPYGINLMEFIKAYNEATKDMIGTVVPVDITIYSDRSFTFVLRKPPVSELLKRAANLPEEEKKGKRKRRGSQSPGRVIVGRVTKQQVREIALLKLPDLNTDDLEAAMRTVEGVAKSMGIEVVP